MTALSPVHTVGRQLGDALRLRHPELSRAEVREKGIALLGQVHIPCPETRWKAYPHQSAAKRLAEGYTFATVSGDLVHLEQAANQHLSAARGAQDAG
ncbi:hypothetical protein ACIBBE_18050 [Streptomyces sp. NPDC051644]|uniref:hypothetical protein n=1 Tax=Streptomyces sp. NPDC051644 TaxID=3365666 RepID=UPI0037B171F9